LDVGQLCISGNLAGDFAEGGNSLKELEEIREFGLVKSNVLEVFPWASQIALKSCEVVIQKELVMLYVLRLMRELMIC
jgi:hypothetical protein